MKCSKRAVLAVAAVVVLLLGIGLLLPSASRCSASVVVNAPASKVYPLIADPRQ